ncbi:MAG: KH domain-containing protein [Opitutaceae bacterium]|nr:KH domain-containing protein [Opitutaceae bacterium]
MDLKETNPISRMTDVLLSIVKGLVRQPDKVKINVREIASLTVFQIQLEKNDIPLIIGKGGKHFRSIKTFALTVGRRFGRDINVVVDEDVLPQSAKPPSRNFDIVTDPEAVRRGMDKLTSLINEMIGLIAIDKFTVERHNIGGPDVIYEVKSTPEDEVRLFGPMSQFPYGPDGLVYGSIKNIVDALGKTLGRRIRLVLNKLN